MLALSRKEGQTIYIDGDIEITITSIRGNRVTLGIEAPRERHIQRAELRDLDESRKEKRVPLSKVMPPAEFGSLTNQVPCCG